MLLAILTTLYWPIGLLFRKALSLPIRQHTWEMRYIYILNRKAFNSIKLNNYSLLYRTTTLWETRTLLSAGISG